MSRNSLLFISTLLATTSAAMAGPVSLTDQQLASVSAGTTDYENSSSSSSGGAIVGNSSSATLSTTGHVSVNDGVQQSARAVNLVNTAESSMANGVNVWDGTVDAQGSSSPLDVQQGNSIVQNQSHSASLPNYVRTDANTVHTVSSSSNTTHTGSVDTSQQILGQELQGGMGVSIAGQIDAALTGGSITLTNHIGGTFDGNVNGNVGFGFASSDASAHVAASTDQTLNWVLPDLTLSARGAGCYVEIGSCDSQGTYNNTSTETTITNSPFTMQNAKAEYIVIDGSTLEATNDYSVSLTGSAQSNAQAVNIANAAGSAVTNAVNVSRSPTMGPSLNLSQVNSIVQTR